MSDYRQRASFPALLYLAQDILTLAKIIENCVFGMQ